MGTAGAIFLLIKMLTVYKTRILPTEVLSVFQELWNQVQVILRP